MLGIILNILKIIGIILLVLIGLILLLLLIVLLVPIRYQFDLRKPEEPDFAGDLSLTWLLRMLRVKLYASREGLIYTVHLLCFRLAGNEPEPEEAQDKKDDNSGTEKAEDKKDDDSGTEKEKEAEPEETEALDSAPETEPEQKESLTVSGEKPPEATPQAGPDDTETAGEAGQKKEKKKKKDRKKDRDSESKDAMEAGKTAEEDLPGDEEGLLDKIVKLWEKLRDKVQKAQELRKKIDDMHLKACLSFGLDLIKRILIHILPRKLEGQVDYGFTDAYRTGQVTGYAALLYPYYGKTVDVRPHFDEDILKGWLKGSGRIRVGFLVWQLIRLLINKDTRRLIIMIIRKNK